MVNTTNDTITAIASGIGGAITLIRVSGPQAIAMGNALFCPAQGKGLADSKGFTLHYGTICEQERVIDDVLISLFRAPHSYTGEDMLEISCHASPYIQQEILRLLIAAGARMATPGEFTLRAFLAGKMDLSQAEAVADVIAADSRASDA
ncbi:MAG: tRNA uridine-5-carboxymethylaminomethyl(34) synthesis GTPase MnmE, partial [Alistipes sp.]|nr:tRNA uridine-5-carboxymethylaminomethyl(34) synthesis GTPase MnmE [Alistipes sp.]